MAWSYPRRFAKGDVSVQNQALLHDAHLYQKAIATRRDGTFQRMLPKTAGAGNGQGRKPKWNSKTTHIRIPLKYAARLKTLAQPAVSNRSAMGYRRKSEEVRTRDRSLAQVSDSQPAQ